MAIEAADLLAPNGPLDLAPGEQKIAGLARIQVYVDQAYADDRVIALPRTVQDTAVSALASYTGLMADYRRMLREPNSVTVAEKGASSYTDAQRAAVLALAKEYLAQFTSLLPVEDAVPIGAVTTSVPNRFVW